MCILSRSALLALSVFGLLLTVSARSQVPKQKVSGPLSFSITLTETEHGRDSNSTRTIITLVGNEIILDEAYFGYRASKREPVHKKLRLTTEEISKLRSLIQRENLLRSQSVKFPPGNGPYKYYDLTVNIRSQRRTSLIKIAGPLRSDEMKSSQLYLATEALMDLVRAMIDKG